jgi:hypothetical protein
LAVGTYAYLDGFYGNAGEKARLLSSIFRVGSGMTCEFRLFYHMYGSTIGTLSVYKRIAVGGLESTLFTKTGEVGNFWNRVDLKITGDQPFQIVVEATSTGGYYGEIAIDDTSFTPGCVIDNSPFPSITPVPTTTTTPRCGLGNFECKSGQCIPGNKVCNFKPDCSDSSDEINCGTCDFETSSCGWYDGGDDEFKFVRKQAPSPNSNGPQVDHTYGANKTGTFIYTELDPDAGSFPSSATLFGPVFQETGEYCKMTMWIYMDGNFPYIDIYYVNSSSKNDYDFLDYIYGSQGKTWKKHTIDIGKQPAGYQIEIAAYPDYNSELDYYDIAFDDIQFVDCAPDSVVVDKSLDCDFEKDFCNYTTEDSSSTTVAWRRKANSSNLYDPTGPSFDHTTGTGYYALFSSYTVYPRNKTGRMFSSIQTVLVGKPMCYSMWYHMFGVDVDTLSLYIDRFQKIGSTGFTRTLLWSKKGSQGDNWFNVNRNILSLDPWRIVIKGTVGLSYLHEIAVDDLSLTEGECAPQKVCDFENGFCQWTNTVNTTQADLKWSRGMPATLSNFYDHSTQSPDGSVAYVNFTNAVVNSRARLMSPTFSATSRECLRFWYILNSPQAASLLQLNLYQSTQAGESKLDSLASKNGELEWRYRQVSFASTSNNNNYSIIFEGLTTTSTNGNNTIAIDDISITAGDCPPPIDCNFENFTTCNWQQYKYDRMDWLLNRGETDSAQTGNFSLFIGSIYFHKN